jgi:HAAS
VGNVSSTEGSPVEAYLDRLFDLLAGSGAAGRRALAEVSEHLREATDEGLAAGQSRTDAEAAAVERFGPVEMVARGLLGSSGRAGLRVLARQAFGAGWLLGGIGLLSIGLSGALSWAVAVVYGNQLVASDPPTEVLSPARCDYLLEYYPSAGSCQAASVAHHTAEIVRNGLASGVLGALALLAYWLVRRSGRFRRLRSLTVTPPAGIVAAVGAATFGVAAAVLVQSGLSRLLSGQRWGAGFSLVAGLSAVPAFVLFAVLLVRELRLHAA